MSLSLATAADHRHAVQFYSSEGSLFTTVGGFISEGLITGQPAVVIATESHRDGIMQNLVARRIDVAGARHTGDLVFLDADATLATFMISEHPDPAAFKRHVGDVIEQALGGRRRTPVRAYGEMVDLLWKQGRVEAAIRLEILWNELATTHAFSLVCGYSMGNFYKQAEQFQRICEQHTHVLTPDTALLPFERRTLPS